MRHFTADQTTALLPWRALAEALLRAAAGRRAGTVSAPERMVFPLAGEDLLLLMPASDAAHACVKLVSVNHGNPARALPRVQGEVVLMDRASGERLALFDGVALTARRTAGVSLAAALQLGARPGGRLLIVGAGVQALAHAQAFAEVLAPSELVIAARRPASATALVAQLAAQGIAARALATDAAAADPARALSPDSAAHAAPEESRGDAPPPAVGALSQAVAQADWIVTATTSRHAVIADTVRPGALVFAVGAFTPQMCELPASLVRRATVWVDTREGARHEAGDLLQAGVDLDGVRQLGDDAPGAALAPPGAAPDPRPVVFKSVGSAVWDLAAAVLAWQQWTPTPPGAAH